MVSNAIVFLCLFFLFQLIAADFQRTAVAFFKGGIPDCKICGDPGAYACSNGMFGDWNDGTLYIQDPLNATEAKLYVPTAITATLYGAYGCDKTQASMVDIRVELAGTVLQINKVNSDLSGQCACGSCNSVTFPATFAGVGFPNYINASPNKLRITVKNNFVCVNRVQLSITYSPVPPRNWLYQSFSKFYTKGGEGCAYCGDYGQFTCNDDATNWVDGRTLKVDFIDPLPRGAVLYMANVTTFGAYNCLARSGSYDTISVSLQGTSITSKQVYYSGGWNCSCSATYQSVGCNGGVTFNTDRAYPTGWPQYVYGGRNTLLVTIPSANYRYCYSRVDVAFTVYYRGKVRHIKKTIMN